MPSQAELEQLEARVRDALRTGSVAALDVIGFGEVSTVLRLPTRGGEVACKRLLPYADRQAAERSAAVIRAYVAGLRERGIDVIDSDVRTVTAGSTHVVYVVQPALPAETLGPEHFRTAGTDRVVRDTRALLGRVRAAVSETFAPDGQLANWAFEAGRLLYLDVTSPFMRDAQGRELFDFDQVVRVLPRLLRFPVRRWAISATLDTYFTVRGQGIDFLGNLEKEGLGHLIEPLLPVVNETLGLDPPIDLERVRRYYDNDARSYALLQAAARLHCFVEHRVLLRPYPFLPKPPVQRFRSRRRSRRRRERY